MNVVFIGQGPNQTAWEHGLELGGRLLRASNGTRTPEDIAVDYCARVAITGSVGSKLATLLGIAVGPFSRSYARRNLNARWNGKQGKGDRFDFEEGKLAAAKIEAEGKFDRFVLLGGSVTKCFGFTFTPLEIRSRRYDPRRFLCFPHPSGINLWWNEPFNHFRAEKRLREFLDPTNKL